MARREANPLQRALKVWEMAQRLDADGVCAAIAIEALSPRPFVRRRDLQSQVGVTEEELVVAENQLFARAQMSGIIFSPFEPLSEPLGVLAITDTTEYMRQRGMALFRRVEIKAREAIVNVRGLLILDSRKGEKGEVTHHGYSLCFDRDDEGRRLIVPVDAAGEFGTTVFYSGGEAYSYVRKQAYDITHAKVSLVMVLQPMSAKKTE